MKRLKKMSKIKFFAKIVDFCKFLKVPSSRNIGFLENKNLQDIRYIKNVVYPSYHESFMPLSEEQQKEKQEKKVIAAELPIKNEIKAGLEHLEYQTDEAGETEKCYYLAPYYYMELAVARMLIDLDIKPEV